MSESVDAAHQGLGQVDDRLVVHSVTVARDGFILLEQLHDCYLHSVVGEILRLS